MPSMLAYMRLRFELTYLALQRLAEGLPAVGGVHAPQLGQRGRLHRFTRHLRSSQRILA